MSFVAVNILLRCLASTRIVEGSSLFVDCEERMYAFFFVLFFFCICIGVSIDFGIRGIFLDAQCDK